MTCHAKQRLEQVMATSRDAKHIASNVLDFVCFLELLPDLASLPLCPKRSPSKDMDKQVRIRIFRIPNSTSQIENCEDVRKNELGDIRFDLAKQTAMTLEGPNV